MTTDLLKPISVSIASPVVEELALLSCCVEEVAWNESLTRTHNLRQLTNVSVYHKGILKYY